MKLHCTPPHPPFPSSTSSSRLSLNSPQINVPKLSPRMGDSLSSRSSNELLPHFQILYFCFSEMSSFTLKLSSFLVSSPSQSSSSSDTTSYLPPLPLFRFPRTRFNSRGRVAVVGAAESDKNNSPISGDSKTPNGTLPKTRRGILLEYVQNVQPEFMKLFVKRAPQQVFTTAASCTAPPTPCGYI